MSTAYADAEVKSFGDGTDRPLGQFKAVVSVFGNIDLGGDKIRPGAFSKSLDSLQQSGKPLSVYWNHDHDDPFSNIGVVKSAAETPEGLMVDAQLDMDNPKAVQVFNLMQQKRIGQFSFQYQVNPGGFEYKSGPDGRYRELTDLNLLEVGPTWLGMNPQTHLIDAKNAEKDSEDDPEPDETPPKEPSDSNPFASGFDETKLEKLVRGIIRSELSGKPPEKPAETTPKTPEATPADADEAKNLNAWITIQQMIGENHEITA